MARSEDTDDLGCFSVTREKGFDNYFRMPSQIKTELAENANAKLGTEQCVSECSSRAMLVLCDT